jgi:hypothetical protein
MALWLFAVLMLVWLASAIQRAECRADRDVVLRPGQRRWQSEVVVETPRRYATESQEANGPLSRLSEIGFTLGTEDIPERDVPPPSHSTT